MSNRTETVLVALEKAEGAALGTASTGTGTITDDDAVATSPALSIDSPTVTEGDEGSTAMTFTVKLSPAGTKTVTVEYTQGTGSTATAGTDFTVITTSTLTFAAGDTSKTFAVSVTGDTTDEPDETIVVTPLQNSRRKRPSPPRPAPEPSPTTTERPPSSINSPTVDEGHTGSVDLDYTVSLSSVSGKEVTVDYAEGTGGSATAGTDYTALTGGTLTIAAGETSGTVTVSVIGDGLIETDETILMVLSNAKNANIATGTGTGTITNDDGQPSLSIGSPTITEGDSGAKALNFAVTLSQSSAAEITVSYAAEGGSATSGVDYTALTDGTLTFSRAQTSRTITVSVLGDRLDEPDETFTVTLSGPTNATIAAATGPERSPTTTIRRPSP